MLRTQEAEAYSTDATLGWNTVLDGPLTVHQVSGNHDNILSSPQVELIAEKMRAVIARDAVRTRHAIRRQRVRLKASGRFDTTETAGCPLLI